MSSGGSKSLNAFFYGTLMHPKILKRVIGNNGSHLQICPAVLMDYTRHKIKGVDYPGIVPYQRSRAGLPQGREERCVRGTLVTGLTKADVRLLDYFEGEEYTRDPVKVYPLGQFTDIANLEESTEWKLVPNHIPALPNESELPPSVEAETYVFQNLWMMEPEPWSFTDFVERNAWKWYGKGAEGNEDITEVDRRRERGQNDM